MHRLSFTLLLLAGLPAASHAQSRASVAVQLTVIEAGATVHAPACVSCGGSIVTRPGVTPTVLLRWEDSSGSVLRSGDVAPRRPARLQAAGGGVELAGAVPPGEAVPWRCPAS